MAYLFHQQLKNRWNQSKFKRFFFYVQTHAQSRLQKRLIRQNQSFTALLQIRPPQPLPLSKKSIKVR
jgi:hypothetical protein